MLSSILYVFFITFAVLGICEFFYIIRMLFYFPGKKVTNYSLVFLRKGYALKQLDYIWQKIRWNGDAYSLGIVAVIDDIEQNEIIECENFIEQKNIILCNAVSLDEILQRSYFNGKP